jgi:hypothetical protein
LVLSQRLQDCAAEGAMRGQLVNAPDTGSLYFSALNYNRRLTAARESVGYAALTLMM